MQPCRAVMADFANQLFTQAGPGRRTEQPHRLGKVTSTEHSLMHSQARRQLLPRPRTAPLLHLTQAAEPDVFDSWLLQMLASFRSDSSDAVNLRFVAQHQQIAFGKKSENWSAHHEAFRKREFFIMLLRTRLKKALDLRSLRLSLVPRLCRALTSSWCVLHPVDASLLSCLPQL